VTPRPRSRAFKRFERFVLGYGMSVVAFVIERRLLKALRHGGVKPAPWTAEKAAEAEPDGLAATPQEIGYQPEG
jgi:hypothetical protein